ncbi:MAG: endonuclease/exonuclease/phosphatase family protein [Lachnospiraceae bacterium]|nr:endonuclease/exonuclease/phosphatase family protein [Lachnospiraceae bacterium]
MKILTLNMNMFNYQNDGEFWNYLKEVNPDIAFIQEFRYKNIENCPSEYEYILPKKYVDVEPVDSRVRLTVALHKHVLSNRTYKIVAGDYTFVKAAIKDATKTISGLHMPDLKETKEDEELKAEIVSDIICGDFNADIYKNYDEEPANRKYLKELIEDGYRSLWNVAREAGKAFYIDYKGEKKPANKNYRTFMGNTHIDYILAKEDSVSLNEIVIDLRTLTFTDHSAIIADVALL